MLRIGETIDRYVVEALLGQGGMAAVYRARHSGLDSLHAIKVLFITAPEIRQRLMREGKVQANLRHPNIVAVTDILEVQGAPALVMEYIDGPPLDAWLNENTPSLEEAMFLFRGILRGVMAAHERHVIHRDLKPANVLLAPTNEGVVAKVADFGLTKSVSNERGTTQTGMAMGTPEYMSPEQIRDASDVDQRADMFALGCILYELVTGERCFQGPDNVAVFNAIVNGTYTPPKELKPDLPSQVLTAIRWLLEPQRDRRLASCTELFDLLYEESVGPQLELKAPAEPIQISGILQEPTPGPSEPRVADAMTQPPVGQRMVTPGGASHRVTPMAVGYRSNAVTQLQIEQPMSPSRGLARIVVPVVVVLIVAAVVTVVFQQNAVNDEALSEVARNSEALRAGPGLPEPAPVPTPAPAPQVVPAPTPAPQVVPVPVAAPSPSPQPAPAPAPAQQPAPAPQPAPQPVPQPAPEPAPAPAASGTAITLLGDARSAWLKGSAGRFQLPATVPEGSYEMQADFGEGVSPAGNVDIRGATMKIECQSFLFICGPK